MPRDAGVTSTPGDPVTTIASSSALPPAASLASDNQLTPVTRDTVGRMTSQASSGSDLATPTSPSGGSLTVIQQASHAEVEVPDLGRISVSAKSHDGVVDIHVVTGRSGATETLLSHSSAMESDVRSASIPLRRLDFSTESQVGSEGRGPSASLGGEASSRDAGQEAEPETAADGDAPASVAPVLGRVRIVL
jgi:hypothetical protein